MKRKVVTTLGFRGFRYYCSEAFKCLWYNKLMAVTSIITIVGCLLLFGFFLVIGINVNYITEQIQGQCEVQAFLPVDASAETENAVLEKIKALPNVASVTFESRSQAFEEYKDTLGENSVVMEGLDPNTFLPSSYRIVPSDLTQLDSLCEALSQIPEIEDVSNHRDTVNNVISITSVIRRGCIIFTVLLAVIAVFIISNTIKLDVHARQKEIHIMKYVGATDWFIRWPFIIEGIIVGLFGAVISILLIIAASSAIMPSLSMFDAIFKLKNMSETMPAISAILLVFGMIIGALGSMFAVRKHLQV